VTELTPGPRLLRAEDVYHARHFVTRTSRLALAEWAFQKYPPVFVDRAQPDLSRRGELVRATVVRAEVNHGRWIARCPFCPSAQIVSPEDPRFLCAGSDGCANALVRGAFVAVEFPARRAEVETALLARPDRTTRNWRPGEAVADLIEENAANGLD
jgi:hypothetical protein